MMKHRWERRWWSRLHPTISVQTCRRCGAQHKVEHPWLRTKRRGQQKIREFYRASRTLDYFEIRRMPACPGTTPT